MKCAAKGCSKTVPKRRGAGRPRIYCSSKCKSREYVRTHPRMPLKKRAA